MLQILRFKAYSVSFFEIAAINKYCIFHNHFRVRCVVLSALCGYRICLAYSLVLCCVVRI